VFSDEKDPAFEELNYTSQTQNRSSLTNAKEVEQIIKKNIGTNGAPGPDAISNKAFKNLREKNP